jgi:hypothetical protein
VLDCFVRGGGHQLLFLEFALEFVVVFCFGAIAFVASDAFWNWSRVYYCCVSFQCSCVPSPLLQVTIFGSSLEFLVVVAFHCMFLCVIVFVASNEFWS